MSRRTRSLPVLAVLVAGMSLTCSTFRPLDYPPAHRGAVVSGRLWSLSLETRNETPAADLQGRRGTLGGFSLGTDGQWAYFTWRDDVGDIWVMDVAPE